MDFTMHPPPPDDEEDFAELALIAFHPAAIAVLDSPCHGDPNAVEEPGYTPGEGWGPLSRNIGIEGGPPSWSPLLWL